MGRLMEPRQTPSVPSRALMFHSRAIHPAPDHTTLATAHVTSTPEHTTLASSHTTLTSDDATLAGSHTTLGNELGTLAGKHGTLAPEHGTLRMALPTYVYPEMESHHPVFHRSLITRHS